MPRWRAYQVRGGTRTHPKAQYMGLKIISIQKQRHFIEVLCSLNLFRAESSGTFTPHSTSGNPFPSHYGTPDVIMLQRQRYFRIHCCPGAPPTRTVFQYPSQDVLSVATVYNPRPLQQYMRSKCLSRDGRSSTVTGISRVFHLL